MKGGEVLYFIIRDLMSNFKWLLTHYLIWYIVNLWTSLGMKPVVQLYNSPVSKLLSKSLFLLHPDSQPNKDLNF